MSRQCAYCGTVSNLTREHIFPSAVIAKCEVDLTVSDKSDRYFRSELAVKDVCGTCNNGFLSKLDREFVEVFEKYMSSPIAPGDGAELRFDYSLLLRFLLKVSYNSCRASIDGQKAIEALQQYVPYIRGDTPTAEGIMLRLQIFTSAKKFNIAKGEIDGIIEANILRSAKIAYDGPLCNDFLVRMVAFNSFWFYLIIPTKPTSRMKRDRFIRSFKRWAIQPGIPISPVDSRLVIPVEKTTYIHDSVLDGLYRES